MKDRYGNELKLEDRVNIQLGGTVIGLPEIPEGVTDHVVLMLDLAKYGNPSVLLLVPSREVGIVRSNHASTTETEPIGQQATPDPDLQV